MKLITTLVLAAGTFLATITGAGKPPVLYELPHGLAFTELLALHGVSADQVRGALMGGYFAGLLNRSVLETTLDHETMRRVGSGLGCGAISIIIDDCPVAVAASVLAGGNVRVGLEDNLWLDKGVLATNAQLVERAVTIMENLGARVIGPEEVRRKLGLTKRAPIAAKAA